MANSLADRASRLRPGPTGTLVALWTVVLEAALLLTYLRVLDVTVRDPLVFLYPFVWLDASLVAVVAASPPRTNPRRRRVALVVAAGYLLVLAYFGGLYGRGHGAVPLHVVWSLPPGYGPALLYDGPLLRLVLEPYKVGGYLALAYLVYVTVLDAAGTALSGVVGLFSCVSCSWPLLGTLAAGLFGSGSAAAAFALSRSYGLSTVVFLSALALLSYRPRVGGGV